MFLILFINMYETLTKFEVSTQKKLRADFLECYVNNFKVKENVDFMDRFQDLKQLLFVQYDEN